jgi:hypothetical protein
MVWLDLPSQPVEAWQVPDPYQLVEFLTKYDLFRKWGRTIVGVVQFSKSDGFVNLEIANRHMPILNALTTTPALNCIERRVRGMWNDGDWMKIGRDGRVTCRTDR